MRPYQGIRCSFHVRLPSVNLCFSVGCFLPLTRLRPRLLTCGSSTSSNNAASKRKRDTSVVLDSMLLCLNPFCSSCFLDVQSTVMNGNAQYSWSLKPSASNLGNVVIRNFTKIVTQKTSVYICYCLKILTISH